MINEKLRSNVSIDLFFLLIVFWLHKSHSLGLLNSCAMIDNREM